MKMKLILASSSSRRAERQMGVWSSYIGEATVTVAENAMRPVT